MIRKTIIRKTMTMAATLVMTTALLTGCGAKNTEQVSVTTAVSSQEETKPYNNAEEASRYAEIEKSIHMSRVEANRAYNESLAAKRKEKEASVAASVQASIAEEEASKQAERDRKQEVIESQSVEPGKASEHETTTDVITDPVTSETVTVPEGAVAVLPTEEATVSAPTYPAGTLIETTEQTKADGLWPHNNWTNNLSGYTVPERYYLMLDAANEWCNDGRGGKMSNEELQNRMVAIGTSPKPNMSGVHTYQFAGQTMSSWDFQMEVMDEDAAEGGYAFSYFRSFYDPSTDTTTVWYAYANPFN